MQAIRPVPSRPCKKSTIGRGTPSGATLQSSAITVAVSGKDTVSIAMQEIADDVLGFDRQDFDNDLKGANRGIL